MSEIKWETESVVFKLLTNKTIKGIILLPFFVILILCLHLEFAGAMSLEDEGAGGVFYRSCSARLDDYHFDIEKNLYKFSGDCIHSSGTVAEPNIDIVVDGKWDAQTKVARESFKTGSTGTGDEATLTASCPADPWINNVTCTKLHTSGDPIAVNWLDAVAQNPPLTAQAVTQKEALRAEWLAVIAQPIPPPRPTNLKAKLVGIQFCAHRDIRLTWKDNAIWENRYRIERAVDDAEFEIHQMVSADSESFIDRSDKPGGRHKYRVQAVYVNGSPSAYSNVAIVSMWPINAPAAPTGLRETFGHGGDSPGLAWEDNSTNESGFVIERAHWQAKGWTEAGRVGPNKKSFVDQGPKAVEGRYLYRVQALRPLMEGACSSLYSNVISVQINLGAAGSPAAPSLGQPDAAGNKSAMRIRTKPALTPALKKPAYDINEPVLFKFMGVGQDTVRIEFQRFSNGRWVTAPTPRSPAYLGDTGVTGEVRTKTFRFGSPGKWRLRPVAADGKTGKWETIEIHSIVDKMKPVNKSTAKRNTPPKSAGLAESPSTKAKLILLVPQITYPSENQRFGLPAKINLKVKNGQASDIEFQLQKKNASGRYKPHDTFVGAKLIIKDPGHYRLRAGNKGTWVSFSVRAQLKTKAIPKKVTKTKKTTKEPLVHSAPNMQIKKNAPISSQ